LNKYYDESMMKIIMKNQTTKDIFQYASDRAKEDMLDKMEHLIDEHAEDTKKLRRYFKKLEKI